MVQTFLEMIIFCFKYKVFTYPTQVSVYYTLFGLDLSGFQIKETQNLPGWGNKIKQYKWYFRHFIENGELLNGHNCE